MCTTTNVEMVRSIGADHVIDYTQGGLHRRTAEQYDFILDNVGNRSLTELRRALTPTGTLISERRRVTRWMASGGRMVRAMLVLDVPVRRPDARPNFLMSANQADLLALKALLEAGTVRPGHRPHVPAEPRPPRRSISSAGVTPAARWRITV